MASILLVVRYACHVAVLIALLLSHATDAQEERLSSFVTNPAPWRNMEAGSEQTQPIYISGTPWEIETHSLPASGGVVPLRASLRELGEAQLKLIAKEIGVFNSSQELALEAWPAYDDSTGQVTWAWARWRLDNNPWQFIDFEIDDVDEDHTSIVPALFRPWIPKEADEIFADFLQADDLYTKPVFGNCIWTQENDPNSGFTGGWIKSGWMALSQRNWQRDVIVEYDMKTPAPERIVCRALPQPSRVQGVATTFVVTMSASQNITWPSSIAWTNDVGTFPPPPASFAPKVNKWPATFETDWINDVRILDGETEATFPISGRSTVFRRKNSADPQNQLSDVVMYLQERYQQLGLQCEVDSWTWRNITQQNLIAIIPGSNWSAPPVVVADHIDTAFCEDVFEKTGKRVSAPGADDNASGTATLLRAASVLRSLRPKNPIWLLHLTGEEFPADDLGARQVVSRWLWKQQKIAAYIQLDMIAWRASRLDGVFQVNAGDSESSRQLASLAIQVSEWITSQNTTQQTAMKAVGRTRFDPLSYLYNTDAIILSDAGYPVVLLNEHINRHENFDRPFYHQSTDLANTLDASFGSTVAKVAIELAAQAAQVV